MVHYRKGRMTVFTPFEHGCRPCPPFAFLSTIEKVPCPREFASPYLIGLFFLLYHIHISFSFKAPLISNLSQSRRSTMLMLTLKSYERNSHKPTIEQKRLLLLFYLLTSLHFTLADTLAFSLGRVSVAYLACLPAYLLAVFF